MITFPFREISPEERDNKFVLLSSLKTKELNHSNMYNICSDYYFQEHRLSTKKNKWSNISAWEDPKEREKILAIDEKYNGNKSSNSTKRRIIGLWYGCVGQFRPNVAVFVYQKFKPKLILDFSAGWGDRLVAAMSQNIDYIGIDSNKSLKTPYSIMITDFKKYSTSNVSMYFDSSENIDFSLFPEYDLVFTSPPYFNKEKYNGMNNYTKDEFINVFFKPVVRESWKYLKRGGAMVLNIPESMYSILEPIYGPALQIKMPLRNRSYKEKKQAFEFIYYWTKE